MLVLPGFEIVKKPIKVNRIEYEVEGKAATATDGVTLHVKLYRGNAITFSMDKMFCGHSCIKCPPGKNPVPKREYTFDPPIEADRVVVVANDVECDFQYVRVNEQRFYIPLASDKETVTYEFDLCV
jgi:hypothetical protein